MKYATINAKTEEIKVVNVDDINEAKVMAGLEPLGTDHGTVARGIGITVYEFGLLEPTEDYMIIGRQLFAGNAVLYAYSPYDGETINFVEATIPTLNIKFLHGIEAVEEAIVNGLVVRPYVAFNGEVMQLWRNGALESL